MATTAPKWTEVTVRVPGILGMSRELVLRTTTTGRGKSAVESWQQRVSTELDLDSLSAEQAIARLKEASEGLVDARVERDYDSEYRTEYMVGWETSVSEERIALGRERIQALTAAKRADQERRETAERAKLLELARQYPDALRDLVK